MMQAFSYVIGVMFYAAANAICMPPKWIPPEAISAFGVIDGELVLTWTTQIRPSPFTPNEVTPPHHIPTDKLKVPEAEWMYNHGDMLGFRDAEAAMLELPPLDINFYAASNQAAPTRMNYGYRLANYLRKLWLERRAG